MSKRGPRFSEKEKLTIIAEGEKTGVKTGCAKYGISDQTYREWRYKARGIEPKKHHSLKERLQALKEAQNVGIDAVCAKYGITPQTYRVWRYEAQGIKPRKHFPLKKKVAILEEGCRKGVYRTCAAYHIDPITYYRWKRKFGFTKTPRQTGRPRRFSNDKELAIVLEGEKSGIKAVCAKYGISDPTFRMWRRKHMAAAAA